MSDSRVEKVRAVWPDDDVDYVPMHLRTIESAGLLVFDPTDPAVIDRVARALWDNDDHQPVSWDDVAIAPAQALYRNDARAVLAALGGDQA